MDVHNNPAPRITPPILIKRLLSPLLLLTKNIAIFKQPKNQSLKTLPQIETQNNTNYCNLSFIKESYVGYNENGYGV
jgi:hypothetical protein